MTRAYELDARLRRTGPASKSRGRTYTRTVTRPRSSRAPTTTRTTEPSPQPVAARRASRRSSPRLEIISSPYRELVAPIERYIDDLAQRYDNDTITVIIPEFIVDRWYEHVLHNQSALLLKGRLLFRKNMVVISVPYHVHSANRNGAGTRDGRPTT